MATKDSKEKKIIRNKYLMLLSDEELDVLEILAKKATKERQKVDRKS